jgi:hypothetical protein
MQLLFLSNFYPPYHLGGYEELCADVAEGLRERGQIVSVLKTHQGIDRPPRPAAGVERLLHPEVQ